MARRKTQRLEKLSDQLAIEELCLNVGDEYKILNPEQDPVEKRLLNARNRRFSGYLDDYTTQHFDKRKQITDYFAGEYTETNDEEFAVIFEKFFEYWYWSEIWVCYSETLLETEIQSWKNRLDIEKQKCAYKCPYRLFTKVKRISQTKSVYSSIWTGIHYEIDEEIIPMIYASCNNGLNERMWRRLIKEHIAGIQQFITVQNLSTKVLFCNKINETEFNKEKEQLKKVDPIFHVNGTELTKKNQYDVMQICDTVLPKTILDNITAYFLKESAGLGYVENMNDKKERLTTGENFKDLKAISNIQYRHLKNLNTFAKNFNDEYPDKDLNFNLSNWGAESQGVPTPIEQMDEDLPENNINDKYDRERD